MTVASGRNLRIEDHAIISATADADGNISLRPGPGAVRDSRITARARQSGGQISIDPRFVILDRSVIDGRVSAAPPGNRTCPSPSVPANSPSPRTASFSPTRFPRRRRRTSLVRLSPWALWCAHRRRSARLRPAPRQRRQQFHRHRWRRRPLEPGSYLPDLALRAVLPRK